ncbi:MAG: phosphate signaling complex PhoU family protein, partial [Desulfohalobiaceae bacterium]
MPIRTAESLEENFKFLALEVAKQVRSTTDILEAPKKETVARVVSRDDYIDNLKTIIENKCFSQIHGGSRLDRREINRIRAIHIICVNLERIADFCVNVIQQLDYFSDPAFIRGYDYRSMFDTIEEALGEVIPVLDSGNLARALAICKAEFDLDLMYKECFHKILDQLSTGKQVGDLVTTLYIFRYLERIGDSLLNIGEAAIFAFLGRRSKSTSSRPCSRHCRMPATTPPSARSTSSPSGAGAPDAASAGCRTSWTVRKSRARSSSRKE